MKHLLPVLALAALLLAGCEPKPDRSLVLWEQPSPDLASAAHVKERPGLIRYQVLPTGSMEPFMTGGDYVVVDTTVPFDKAHVPVGSLVNYLPSPDKLRYYPGLAPGVTVTHMLAAWSDDSAVMDGLHNAHYEGGVLSITKANYVGKVIQIYTKRRKP